MIRLTAAAANDSQFLREVHLPKGSIIVFDRGYYDFTTLNRFTYDGIAWVTRLRKLFAYDIIEDLKPENNTNIKSDEHILLGYRSSVRVKSKINKIL